MHWTTFIQVDSNYHSNYQISRIENYDFHHVKFVLTYEVEILITLSVENEYEFAIILWIWMWQSQSDRSHRYFTFTFTDCLLDKKILLLKSKCKVAVWAIWMWLSHPYPQNDCKIVLILNRGGNPNNITCCIIICKYEFHELRTTSIQIDSNYHMKGLCINFLCFIKRRSYVTAGGLYHRPNWN